MDPFEHSWIGVFPEHACLWHLILIEIIPYSSGYLFTIHEKAVKCKKGKEKNDIDDSNNEKLWSYIYIYTHR